MEELRAIEPNPSQAVYLEERELLLRKFCIQQAVEAGKNSVNGVNVFTLAQTMYKFLQDPLAEFK